MSLKQKGITVDREYTRKTNRMVLEDHNEHSIHRKGRKIREIRHTGTHHHPMTCRARDQFVD